MGSKNILIAVFILYLFTACQCSKKPDSSLVLSASQKEWFSNGPNGDSTIIVRSDNGLSDFLSYSSTGLIDDVNMISGGECPKYQGNERYSSAYSSLIAGTYWTFIVSNYDGSNEFYTSIQRFGGDYSECDFTLDLDNMNTVKKFLYSPYAFKQNSGFAFVGDTVINGTNYSDIYRMDIQLPPGTKPLDIKQIILSKKKGLVCYQTYNNVKWYLAL
jgi:hypothetical protein